MIKDSYDYLVFQNKTYYYFESEGKQGTIQKAIIFTLIEDDIWNLAFGDFHKGEIDDSVISNNHDIVKLFNTIAKAVYEFSAEFPKRHINIEPVDEKRRKLYNHIFRRNYEDISLIFYIIGIYSNKLEEDYSGKNFYTSFKLIRKFVK